MELVCAKAKYYVFLILILYCHPACTITHNLLVRYNKNLIPILGTCARSDAYNDHAINRARSQQQSIHRVDLQQLGRRKLSIEDLEVFTAPGCSCTQRQLDAVSLPATNKCRGAQLSGLSPVGPGGSLSNAKMSGSGRLGNLSCSFSKLPQVWNAGPSITGSPASW